MKNKLAAGQLVTGWRKQNKEDGFQTSNVMLVAFTHLLHDIYSSFLSPLLPLLIKKFGLSYSMASLLTMMQNLPAVLNPLLGIFADKIKMRYLVIITPGITSVSMSLLGVAPHYSLLIILTLTMGFSSALFHVPTPVMMKKVAGKRVGKGMSFYMLGGEVARTLGPMVIVGAVSLWGLEGTYRLLPFGILSSVFLYFRLRRIKISENVASEKYSGVKAVLKPLIPFYLVITGYLVSRAVMTYSLTAFLPTYLTLRGNSLWLSGAALSILQIGSVAGTYFSGTFSDKIGRKTTLLIIAIVSPALMWMFILFKGMAIMFGLLILIGFFHFSTSAVLLAMVQDIQSDRPALLNSIFMTISFGISALMVWVVGLLADWTGLENTYKISAFIALLGIPFVLSFKKKRQ